MMGKAAFGRGAGFLCLKRRRNSISTSIASRPRVTIPDVCGAAQPSIYVNDFNIIGRTYRVMALVTDGCIGSERQRHACRSASRRSVTSGPSRVPRYLYPAAEFDGSADIRRGQQSKSCEACGRVPPGFSYEWTDLLPANSRRQHSGVCIRAGRRIRVPGARGSVWPDAAARRHPDCSDESSITGVILRGMDNNILTQVGFIVLIGLAAKNAILIVEFAEQLEARPTARGCEAASSCAPS